MEAVKERGMLCKNSGIIGHPDEPLSSMVRTYAYLLRRAPLWQMSILEPRPGNEYWDDWRRDRSIEDYRKLGKLNVLLVESRWRRMAIYVLSRFMALLYFLDPRRIWGAAFVRDKHIQYWYRVHYRVAFATVKANLLDVFRRRIGR
jgi:hypothetical protein